MQSFNNYQTKGFFFSSFESDFSSCCYTYKCTLCTIRSPAENLSAVVLALDKS